MHTAAVPASIRLPEPAWDYKKTQGRILPWYRSLHCVKVWCRYNTINFLQNPHKRHPIARPKFLACVPVSNSSGHNVELEREIMICVWTKHSDVSDRYQNSSNWSGTCWWVVLCLYWTLSFASYMKNGCTGITRLVNLRHPLEKEGMQATSHARCNTHLNTLA